MTSTTIVILVTILLYMGMMIGIGFAVSKQNKSSSDFFLGGRKLGPFVTAMSAEASDMSGWLLMGILFIPMFCAGIVMMIKNPELLKKRLDAKEKQKEQQLVVKLSGLMFIAGFVLAGLDFRFEWLPVPPWISIVAAILFLFAYVVYAEVLRENTYLSRTIEVQENQKVIDTG